MENTKNGFTEFVKSLFSISDGTEVIKDEVPNTDEVVKEVLSTDEVAEVMEAAAGVEDEDTVTIEEIKEVAEKAVELSTDIAKSYITEETVRDIVSEVVSNTLHSIQMSAQKASEANGELVERLEKLELELNTPAKKAEVVVPTEVEENKSFIMFGDEYKV